jgi:lipooligosaccharide transport system permease protein
MRKKLESASLTPAPSPKGRGALLAHKSQMRFMKTGMTSDFSLTRWLPIWRRHFLSWRRYWLSSLMFSFGEPFIYMLGLGYGLGRLVPELGGMSYIMFVASGTLAFSIVNGATFEGMYSAFARMQIQRTWDAITNAPMSLSDVVLAEWIFAASKSVLSCMMFATALILMGVSREWTLIFLLPCAILIGAVFAGIALIMCSIAKGYEFFSYWFSLGIMPLAMISGVFFPMSELPSALQTVSYCLPMSHAVELVRPFLQGKISPNVWLHVAVLVTYAIAAFSLALYLFRRRFAN